MLSSTLLRTTDQLFSSSKHNLFNLNKFAYCSSTQIKNDLKAEDDFIFEAPDVFPGSRPDIVKGRSAREIPEKLRKSTIDDLPTDADWQSVWPTASTFDPNRVPLPLHQGAPMTNSTFRTRLDRWQNSELIKIPNFLHLTPKAIKRQTDAIKKYCTKWPKELTKEKLDELYPVIIYSQDRVAASPSIRDPLARVISLELHISQLKLDEHAKDKLLELLSHRYDPKTGYIKITTSDCPFKEQNLELSIYRLTACYFEAWKTEEWELIEKE